MAYVCYCLNTSQSSVLVQKIVYHLENRECERFEALDGRLRETTVRHNGFFYLFIFFFAPDIRCSRFVRNSYMFQKTFSYTDKLESNEPVAKICFSYIWCTIKHNSNIRNFLKSLAKYY